MKKIAPVLALLTLSAPAISQTLEERIEALELSNDLNWIKWSGSLESRYDYIDSNRKKTTTDANGLEGVPSGTPSPFNIQKGRGNNQFYRLWANLNLEAKPTDRLAFFGRLSMAKYMNATGFQGPASSAFRDGSEGNLATDTSTLFLERAFVNYAITDSLTFTMGRLPTIDGPNKHVALNQQLMGNYPSLAYSAILDGFAFTKSFDLGSSRVARAKAIYTPGQTINADTSANPAARLVNSNGKKIGGVSDGFYSVLGEYEQSAGSFFDKNLTIFQFVRTDQNILLDAPEAFGGNPSSDLKFQSNRFTLYTEFERIGKTDFDIALQGAFSQLRSNGDAANYIVGNQGWATDKSGKNVTGYATALTVRYQLPFKALNRPKIGAEWFHSSKRVFLYDIANVNPINMYQSPDSDVYHLFWNQKFSDGLSMNIGYMYRKQNSTFEMGGLFGKNLKVNNHDQNIYASLLATF